MKNRCNGQKELKKIVKSNPSLDYIRKGNKKLKREKKKQEIEDERGQKRKMHSKGSFLVGNENEE